MSARNDREEIRPNGATAEALKHFFRQQTVSDFLSAGAEF